MADSHKNFAYSTVLTAPSPASSGTSLVVQSGDGAKFPAVPFNATVWPASAQPTTANAEIVRVTARSTDTLTITRAQEGTSARTVVVGDQIAATVTAKTLTDIEAVISSILPAASGSDDASAIQSVLSGGGYVRGRPGQSYILGSSLVIPSNTTLDMTGCTITETNSVGAHMIQNYSYANPVATASDAAMTSGSNVVTTSLGASATVGQAVVVEGAGGNGNGVLVGIISAKTSTTITLVRLRDGLAANASATVSTQSVKVFNRDSNIRIIGGIWNLGNNSPNPYPAILGYHVDDLIIDIEGYTATAGSGSRGIGISDVRGFFIRMRNANTVSVAVQLTGPLARGRVDYIGGTASDDLLAVVASDDTATSNHMGGDITDLEIGEVNAVSTNGRLLNIISGSGRLVDCLRVTGTIAGTGNAGLVYLGDDTGSPATTGGTYGDIDLGLVDVIGSGDAPINLSCPNIDKLTVRLKHNPPVSANGLSIAGTSTTATIRQLNISGVSTGLASNFVYLGSTSVTINELVVDGVVAYGVPAGGWNLVNVDGGTINQVILRDCRMDVSGTSQYAVIMNAGVGTSTVNRILFSGGSYSGGAHLVNSHAQTGSLLITFEGCVVSSFGRVGQFSTATTILLASPEFNSISFELFYVSAGSLVVQGLWGGTASNGLFDRSASQSVRVDSPHLSTDVSLLTPTEGDLAINTNAALTAGTGLVVYHNSAWTNVSPDGNANLYVVPNNELVPANGQLVIDDYYEIGANTATELASGGLLSLIYSGGTPNVGVGWVSGADLSGAYVEILKTT